jgi:hypothetical protein
MIHDFRSAYSRQDSVHTHVMTMLDVSPFLVCVLTGKAVHELLESEKVFKQ